MSSKPNFIEGNTLLANPFQRDGRPTLTTSILATLLHNEPLTKETILGKIGQQHTGKSRGYLCNHFATLSKLEIIEFKKRDKTWSQGKRFKEYMGFVFAELVFQDKEAINSMRYHLMPKKGEQSVDFITCPTEDIFSQPNPYLD